MATSTASDRPRPLSVYAGLRFHVLSPAALDQVSDCRGTSTRRGPNLPRDHEQLLAPDRQIDEKKVSPVKLPQRASIDDSLFVQTNTHKRARARCTSHLSRLCAHTGGAPLASSSSHGAARRGAGGRRMERRKRACRRTDSYEFTQRSANSTLCRSLLRCRSAPIRSTVVVARGRGGVSAERPHWPSRGHATIRDYG
jgi:hypothetical protein